MENFLNVLQLHTPITQQIIDDIYKAATKRYFRARVRILSPNEDQGSLLFVNSGITRNFYKSKKKEWTSKFCQIGDFVMSVDNFLFDLPCKELIETCTPVEFIEIPKKNYLQLLLDHPELNIVVRNITSLHLRLGINRMYSWQMQSALARYHSFVQQHPDLYKNVQLQHIASYLGISPYNLSRIRKQYKNGCPLE
ncbi:Crp/Fnr family transcriptional regulator [Dyadobacter sp. 32]|uniref:Crp/Fnr family transcriptional regulator n=1 Tax=Dyadobacter sp. 32 TaxID=538966 RepID=UPI0011EBE4D1